jgi:hypothetical protein
MVEFNVIHIITKRQSLVVEKGNASDSSEKFDVASVLLQL